MIGIDEAQFFGDLYDFCCEAADLDGKTVVVAGLDGDYLRQVFNISTTKHLKPASLHHVCLAGNHTKTENCVSGLMITGGVSGRC